MDVFLWIFKISSVLILVGGVGLFVFTVFETGQTTGKIRKLSKELRGLAMDQPKDWGGEMAMNVYIDSAERIEKEFGIEPTGPFQRDEDD